MLPIVFIPGMMCDARLFAPQLVAFAPRMLMVASISQHQQMDKLANEVLCQAPTQFVIAGLSMGGIVAMEIVRQQPDRVRGLCLMDTNPFAEANQVKHKREPQIDKVKQGKLAEVMRNEMKPNYLTHTKNRLDILNVCMDMALNLGTEVFIRQSRALQNRVDQQHTLANYKRPALILHGEYDTLCPADRHQTMHQLMPHARYAVISDAAHLPTLEQPQQVNDHMRDWLGLCARYSQTL